MNISSLIFRHDSAGQIFSFNVIRENYDELRRLYEATGFTFFDEKRFIFNAMSFSLDNSPEDISSFIETGKFNLRFSLPDEILEDDSGYLAREIVPVEKIVAMAADVDVQETYQFVNQKFMLEKEQELSIYVTYMRSSRMVQNALNNTRKLFGESNAEQLDNNAIKAYPDIIRGESAESRAYLLSKFLRNSPDEVQAKIFRHLLIHAGSLSLKARFELFSVYQKNRLAIQRMIRANRSRDPFNRLNAQSLRQAVERTLLPKTSSLHDSFVPDIVTLYDSDNSDATGEMTGGEFEVMCLEKLIAYGFEAYITKSTGDFGADIIAEKDGLTYCIQCKNLSRPVGIKAVQEVVGAQRHYSCDFGVIVSVTAATQAASELANSTNVIIIDFDGLARMEHLT